MRIALAQLNPTIGDLQGNTQKIVEAIHHAQKQSADLILFSELCLSGYPPDDFLLLPHFLKALEESLEKIVLETAGITAIVGMPRRVATEHGMALANSAAVIADKRLIGFQDKVLLPTYDVFDEKRYFHSGKSGRLWPLYGQQVGITICEDVWQHSELLQTAWYEEDPIRDLKGSDIDLLVNLSASPYSLHKPANRLAVCSRAARALNCPVALCNQVGGNDSLLFDGNSLFVNAQGELIHSAAGFKEDFLLVNTLASSPIKSLPDDPSQELYNALVMGIRDYFYKSGFKRACLGLSGGIDSALVAVLAAEALGPENILGVSLPSRYSSEGSLTDAQLLASHLGINYTTIPIEESFQSYLDTLKPHFAGYSPDVTEENLQARIRGTLLMALSNKFGYILLSTGNKSELAMGYSTLYGDLCGGLAVISDLTKQQVYQLAHWINRNQEIIPLSTLTKPPSAELRPNQKDSDSLPDYAIVDHVLEAYVEDHQPPKEIAARFGYPLSLVEELIQRIHRQEYKRRQSPPGLRVSEKAFNVGRRFPIVQKWI